MFGNVLTVLSYAHTLVGVGCMVVNAQDEVLAVQVSHLQRSLVIFSCSYNCLKLHKTRFRPLLCHLNKSLLL